MQTISINNDFQDILNTFQNLANHTTELTNCELTGREKQCVLLLLCGLTDKQIAKKLQISPRTVELYIRQLMAKFKASTRTALIVTVLHIAVNTASS